MFKNILFQKEKCKATKISDLTTSNKYSLQEKNKMKDIM